MPLWGHRRVPKTDNSDFEQRGDMWKALRRTMLTGSQAGLIHNKGGHDTGNAAKVKRFYTEPTKNEEYGEVLTDMFAYGTNMEPRAIEDYKKAIRSWYEKQYPGQSVEVSTVDVNFYIHYAGLVMASPDGEVNVTITNPDGSQTIEEGVLEVKTPCGKYFGVRNSYFIRDPKNPITYTNYPNLLPGLSETRRKYGPGSLPRPRMHLGKKQNKEDFLRDNNTTDQQFSSQGLYSQYFCQCLLNLFLSEREWCDFCVWTDSTKSSKGLVHTFWYKHDQPEDTFKSIHIERIYRSDPAVVAMHEDLMESIRGWTQEHERALSLNIASFLEVLTSSRDGVALELPVLTEAELEEACPEEGDFLEEGERQED